MVQSDKTITTEPVPKEELERALRSLCRRIGAQVIAAMAHRDADFAHMGMKLDKPEKYVRQCVHDLIEGRPLDLSTISDLACSLGMEWHFAMQPVKHD